MKKLSRPNLGYSNKSKIGLTKPNKASSGNEGVMKKFLDLDSIPDEIPDNFDFQNDEQNRHRNYYSQDNSDTFFNNENENYDYYDQDLENRNLAMNSSPLQKNFNIPSNKINSTDDDDFDSEEDILPTPPRYKMNRHHESNVQQSSSRSSQYCKSEKPKKSEVSSSPPPLPCENSITTSNLSEQDKLYFSKERRKIDYKPYTLNQYKMIKPKDYVEISNIKPDLNSEELVAKRKNLERIKDFSKKLNEYNRSTLFQQRKNVPSDEHRSIELSKQKLESKRQKAIDFARNIPKPKTNKKGLNHNINYATHESDHLYENDFIDEDSRRLLELQEKHDLNKAKIETIKKSMGLK